MKEPAVRIGFCALAILGASVAVAGDRPDPSDLPASVAAPPLRTLKAKEVARVAGEHPFDVPGVDAIFFFLGPSLHRLEVVGPRAGRERKLIEDARLLEVDHHKEKAVTPFAVAGRAFAAVNVRATALLLDLDGGRVLPIRAHLEGADPVGIEVRNVVLDRATSVLCYAEIADGPSNGKDVWTKLDVTSGDATLVPCPECQRYIAGKGGVFFAKNGAAVDIDMGRRLPGPDRRLVPHYEFEDRDRVLIAALPLQIGDWEAEARTVGLAHAGQVIVPVHFPEDVREPLRAEVGDGFAAYLVRAERPDLFLGEMRPDAQARRVAHDVDEGNASFSVVSGGYCVFQGDLRERALVYSFDRHVVFDPFEGTQSRAAAVNGPRIRVWGGSLTAVSSGLGTSPKGIWGAAQILRAGYLECYGCGGRSSWPVVPVTVLISPRGHRFVVDYPMTNEAFGAAELFNRGALVVRAEFRGPEGEPTPGLVLYRLQLPDESPLPRPTPSRMTPTEPPPVAHVLEPGLYLRREISSPVDGRWLGLVAVWETYEEPHELGEGCFAFDRPDRYELAECPVTTRGLESGVEAFRALAVSPACSVSPPSEKTAVFFLVRDVPGLELGPVKRAKEMKKRTNSACGACEAPESGATDLQLGDARYRVELVGTPEAGSKQTKVLRLSFESAAQDLLETDQDASVKWAFDLDRDGRLDLYVEQRLSNDAAQGEKTRHILFLSSLAKPGDLVGEAGRIDVAPIAPEAWANVPPN